MEIFDNHIVTEGKAKVKLPTTVFYNKVQEFNRDLTISVIKTYLQKQHSECLNSKSECKGIKILEALAASGLRSIRFALEIPHIGSIIANDYDSKAVELMNENIKANQTQHLITASQSDASFLMYKNRAQNCRYDVIDLDPYGSASVFLDSAVQSVCEGGLLCVTCTDMAVLCGNVPETCHSKYASVSLKSKFCHEMAIRILLRSIELHANKYSRYIQPLLSLSIDFYCRVFVRIFSGQETVRKSATKQAMVFLCNKCSVYHLQPLCISEPARNGKVKYTPTVTAIGQLCEHCNGRFNIGGPIWSAPIHDVEFVTQVIRHVEENKSLFGTESRIIGMLNVVIEELVDVPLYYDLAHLCTVVHCTAPPFSIMRSAILNGGYQVSLSHANKSSIKTNAPMNFIWDVIRYWVKDNPVNEARLLNNLPAKIILNKNISSKIDFQIHPLANPPSRQKGLLRWQINPIKDWGPGCRATRNKKPRKEPVIKKAKIHPIDLKKYKCKKFTNNDCHLGDNCIYNHNLNEVKNESNDDEDNDDHYDDILDNRDTNFKDSNLNANILKDELI